MNAKNEQRNSPHKKTISARFRKTNIALFLVAFTLIVLSTVIASQSITDTVSKDYAELHSANLSSTLTIHLNREIALVEKVASSSAVIDWFADEYNQEKKAAALSEMLEIVDVLYSDNLYMGIHGSLSEYAVEPSFSVEDVNPHATMRPDYFDDAWYFECAFSPDDYALNVDIDKLLHRKLVWINYKVTSNGEVLGVICSGLDFAQKTEELLAEYDTQVRSLIIDENGIVQMDSISLGADDFLRYERFYPIKDEFNDPAFTSVLETHLNSIDGAFNSNTPSVIELPGKPYSFATIAPIASTKWSVVTFFDSSSLFRWNSLLPIFIVMPAILICFILLSSAVSYRILFRPVELLIQSLGSVSGNGDAPIYGLDRGDEVGSLAKAIRDMLGKVHFDTLTGIYNRRYLDENLARILHSLSRSGGALSILMIDIDFFKQYNDTYGHSNGDECLKVIAGVLTSSLQRKGDFVARYGGEEFAAVLPNTDEEGARLVAERMLESVRACNIPHEKSEAASCVTVSIGVVSGDTTQANSVADCIKKADEALYMSKRSGRNRLVSMPLDS